MARIWSSRSPNVSVQRERTTLERLSPVATLKRVWRKSPTRFMDGATDVSIPPRSFDPIPFMPIPGSVRVCLFFAVSGGRAIVRGKRLRTNSGVSENWSYWGLSPIFDQNERETHCPSIEVVAGKASSTKDMHFCSFGACEATICFVAIVILFSTRGTADSDIWFMCLADKPMMRSYHLRDYDWTPLSQNPA